MSPEEQSDRIHLLGIASGNRYRGNPDLLLGEHPHRNFTNPPPRLAKE